MEKQPIEIRSEEVKDIISYVPKWIVRWGTTVCFIVLLILAYISWLVKYPVVVKGEFRLTSVNAPKPIIARTDGKLVKLFVSDNRRVDENSILAFIESTADHDQVLQLSNRLDSVLALVKKGKSESLTDLPPVSFYQLGEVQASYQTFESAYLEFLSFLSNGFYYSKRDVLQKELLDLNQSEHNLMEQLDIENKEYVLVKKEYDVQEKLFKEKVIAPMELHREEAKLLAKRKALKQAENALINSRSELNLKVKELLDLERLIGQHQNLFLQSLNTLQSKVAEWKKNYLLIAPANGYVRFSSFLEENSSVKIGQEVFYISSEQSKVYGQMEVAQYNLGKVSKGQRVLVKLEGYPYEEFGILDGTISYISEIPTANGFYLAKVNLNHGLKTNIGKILVYRNGMKASGEIITEDLRLSERIFYQLRKITDI
ncbi:HlyD family secretion protein [Xanthocytophaga flava]|uniref:HlyD family secretion protein n=1 Tax=Xanthocytophaga flava TaxID=3048013 RepID=UPI0028D3E2C9|nr:HlyD family efflux transporter periplasmic adaptor subunit [Xanthocytophaga flavus]MDJ1470239.1 HlyD family efflux transporter periplasmic adaptor subunit [Xanthocytophaga flavus]